jgi:hypothetical protein
MKLGGSLSNIPQNLLKKKTCYKNYIFWTVIPFRITCGFYKKKGHRRGRSTVLHTLLILNFFSNSISYELKLFCNLKFSQK